MAESIIQSNNFISDSGVDLSEFGDYFEYSGHHTFTAQINFYSTDFPFLDLASLLEILVNNYAAGRSTMLAFSLKNLHVNYTLISSSGKMPYYWEIQFWCIDSFNQTLANYSGIASSEDYIARIGIDDDQTISEYIYPLTSFVQTGVINPPKTADCRLYVHFDTSNYNDPNPQYYRVDAEFDFTAVVLIP